MTSYWIHLRTYGVCVCCWSFLSRKVVIHFPICTVRSASSFKKKKKKHSYMIQSSFIFLINWHNCKNSEHGGRLEGRKGKAYPPSPFGIFSLALLGSESFKIFVKKYLSQTEAKYKQPTQQTFSSFMNNSLSLCERKKKLCY